MLTQANRQATPKMTNVLFRGLYRTEYMASHCLAGGSKEKEALSSSIVERIVGKFNLGGLLVELFYADHNELFYAGHDMEGLSAFFLLGFEIICLGSVRF